MRRSATPEFVALRGERAEWGPLTRGAGFAESGSGERRQTPEPKRFKLKMGVRQAGWDLYLGPAVALLQSLVRHFFRFPAGAGKLLLKRGQSEPIKTLMPKLAQHWYQYIIDCI